MSNEHLTRKCLGRHLDLRRNEVSYQFRIFLTCHDLRRTSHVVKSRDYPVTCREGGEGE